MGSGRFLYGLEGLAERLRYTIDGTNLLDVCAGDVVARRLLGDAAHFCPILLRHRFAQEKTVTSCLPHIVGVVRGI